MTLTDQKLKMDVKIYDAARSKTKTRFKYLLKRKIGKIYFKDGWYDGGLKKVFLVG